MPLDQFLIIIVYIVPFLYVSMYITNFSIYLFLSNSFFYGLFKYSLKDGGNLLSNKVKTFCEGIFIMIHVIINQQIGCIGLRLLPLFFYTFIFIWSSNLVGLLPYSFTSTSQIILTVGISFSIFLGVVLLGIKEKSVSFFNMFVPSNIPMVILPFIVVIEVMSYFIRPLSLAMRLFANIMAGHTLLNILSGFNIGLSCLGLTIYLLSFLLVTSIMILEFGIAFLQAYVYIVLMNVYTNDSI